jgi:hypothetical protein
MIQLHGRFKPGCSEVVCCRVMRNPAWARGQVRFLESLSNLVIRVLALRKGYETHFSDQS